MNASKEPPRMELSEARPRLGNLAASIANGELDGVVLTRYGKDVALLTSVNTGSAAVATVTQVDPTDASHPSRRPVQSSDPVRAGQTAAKTAQAGRDEILRNLGGKKK